MTLEYELHRSYEGLMRELAPRGDCRYFCLQHNGKATLVTKEEFYSYVGSRGFSLGPFVCSQGIDVGNPSQNRQAFGKLTDQSIVYCELSKPYQTKTDELFAQLESLER